MVSRTTIKAMSIQKRILAGHLAVACLLLIPAGYAVLRLDAVARRTHESLQSGLVRLKVLDQLRSRFEEVARLQKMVIALGDPEPAPGGPDVRAKARASLEALRETHAQARMHFTSLGHESELQHLGALLEPRAASAPTEGAAPSSAGAATGSRPDTPSRGDADISGATAWSDEEIEEARREIVAVYDAAGASMLADTVAAEHAAQRAAGLSVLGFVVGIMLAVGSTIFVVRGIRKPLRRLMSATVAVTAGRFGIEVPVGGGNDEMSRLTNAFNRMSESLANLEKMKADFLSVVSHELKTPLTCIKGFARELRNALQEDVPNEEEVARWLERIAQETDLLARKVSQLNVFGRIEAGQLRLEPREIMTAGFLVMVGEAFKPIAAERAIDFDVLIDGVPPNFVADRDRLNQVLLNLLDNAFKYTPPGGHVALEGRSRDSMLEIEVSDSGPGIAPDQLGIIFEKYARLRSETGRGQDGTGLGLAVARGIVIAHGGTIGVSSQPGKGCRFLVRLPMGVQPAAARMEVVA